VSDSTEAVLERFNAMAEERAVAQNEVERLKAQLAEADADRLAKQAEIERLRAENVDTRFHRKLREATRAAYSAGKEAAWEEAEGYRNDAAVWKQEALSVQAEVERLRAKVVMFSKDATNYSREVERLRAIYERDLAARDMTYRKLARHAEDIAGDLVRAQDELKRLREENAK
jgi:hypothetical protein